MSRSFKPVYLHSHSNFDNPPNQPGEQGLQRLLERLVRKIRRDELVRRTIHEVRTALQVDRVVVYYFYEHWHGQVIFESLSSRDFTILGSTGADDCFSDEYAAMYLEGRVRAIADIDLENIQPCHRDFLHTIQVRSNLVVPILIPRGLWGLLIAHHCQEVRHWLPQDIEIIQKGAHTLALDPQILDC